MILSHQKETLPIVAAPGRKTFSGEPGCHVEGMRLFLERG